jgi:2-oxoisovalerate dehydrogenase E1 component
LACHAAFTGAVAHCRSGAGPAFVHGHVTRPYSHSISDDERAYKYPREREAEALLDPIPKMRGLLIQRGISETNLIELESSVESEIDAAVEVALSAAVADSKTIETHVYSEVLSPCSGQFKTKQEVVSGEGTKTMAELIRICLREEMSRDERIIVFGEDVADCSRDPEPGDTTLKGKGGVFGLTKGLQREFGSERVFNTPLAEASIVGRAVGYATRGMKPVAEIQFMDYIWPAMQQIKNELSVMRWRSNGSYSSPAVIRVPMGGYLGGGGIYHSQASEGAFTHIPGLRVVCPSNGLDANGLLRTAIRCDDPVLFLEHKHLYRDSSARSQYPGNNFMIPFGRASIVQSGKDLTIVTFGALVSKTVEAAAHAKNELGVSIEIIDLRSLSPYDWEAIATSIKKTSRVIVAHEDCLSWGYGSEIVARIADELFYDLDAPVKRIGSLDTFVAYQPLLEAEILPQVRDVLSAINEIMQY